MFKLVEKSYWSRNRGWIAGTAFAVDDVVSVLVRICEKSEHGQKLHVGNKNRQSRKKQRFFRKGP